MKRLTDRMIASDETGAVGYILMWLMGVPGFIILLYLIFGH